MVKLPKRILDMPVEEAVKKKSVLRELKRFFRTTRSNRSRKLDAKYSAKVPKKVGTWARRPNKYDIPGVDMGEKKRGRGTVEFTGPVGFMRSARYKSLQKRSLWFIFDRKKQKWEPLRAIEVNWEHASRSKRWGTGLFRVPSGSLIKNVEKGGETYYIATKSGLKPVEVEKKTKKIMVGGQPVIKLSYNVKGKKLGWTLYGVRTPWGVEWREKI